MNTSSHQYRSGNTEKKEFVHKKNAVTQKNKDKAIKKREQSKTVDQYLEDSFPASDPPPSYDYND